MDATHNLNTQADTLPQRRRTGALFVITYKKGDTTNQLGDQLFVVEKEGKKEAGEFIDSIGPSNVVRVYKVSDILTIRTKTIL